MQGTAFREIKGKLFPSVGMKKSGEHIRVNFGQSPFVFDIDGMMAASDDSDFSAYSPPEVAVLSAALRTGMSRVVNGAANGDATPASEPTRFRSLIFQLQARHREGPAHIRTWTDREIQREKRQIRQEIEATKYTTSSCFRE
jgi:hypothetical protein